MSLGRQYLHGGSLAVSRRWELRRRLQRTVVMSKIEASKLSEEKNRRQFAFELTRCTLVWADWPEAMLVSAQATSNCKTCSVVGSD